MQYLVQDTSITSGSDVTQRPSTSLSSKAEYFSQDKVFPSILKDISEKAEELEALGKQYNLVTSEASRLRNFSNTESEDYGDILYNKGLFLDKLTQALENEVDNSLDSTKYTTHCYNQFSTLLETRCNESKQVIQHRAELLKEQKHETTQLITQGGIFANLVEEENEDLRNQEHRQASLQFEEAKADLVKVINTSLPNEEEKKQFLIVMAELVEAHINHLGSTEDQYVEVIPSMFNNPGLRCLINGFVIVQHPHNLKQIRLSVDD